MRALEQAGFDVVGIGRSRKAALASDAAANWIIRDIPSITVEEWGRILTDVDVVVNASGALQDGPMDDLEAIHVTAVSRLARAAADLLIRVIQISAAGVSETATTAFLRTKARGDAALAQTTKNWVILRPTLLLSPQAYGGTALLRAVSATPLVNPVVMPDAEIQTIHIDDLTTAVLAAAKGDVPAGTCADLTEQTAHRLPELIAKLRRWQGWPDPLVSIPVPALCVAVIGRIADGLGYLGWRSPLRSTSVQVLSDGVHGDPATWAAVGGKPCRPLEQTLRHLPSTRQERLFARIYLALPMAIAVLSLFWIASGLIALLWPHQAMAVLADRTAPDWIIAPSVLGGAVADIVLGLAVLYRPWTKWAALGMIALSGCYLIGGLALAPDLWADPLGPMIKVFPGMALAALVALVMEER